MNQRMAPDHCDFERPGPYLSVVVTTRNDDHGGDPLKRLQAFVNCFDEQCRRSGLQAEVIVVEWNPPAEKPRVSTLLRMPARPCCTYRFIEVPTELHQQLQFGDVLPLFQMIAKNVGIRRATGRFVLATNIDIILDTALVESLAEQTLQAGRLYRVDRHDIEPNLPIEAPLESQMGYCATHQLRLHTRSGSYQVDRRGRHVSHPDDVVDGITVRLGIGWHVRESAGEGRSFRWAGDYVTLTADPLAAGLRGELVLQLDVESNPYDTQSAVDVAIEVGGEILKTVHVAGRMRVSTPLLSGSHVRVQEICLRAKAPSDWRRQLPVFERRDAMFYRVHSAVLTETTSAPPLSDYPVERWQNANLQSLQTIAFTEVGLVVASDPRQWSYCVRYGPLCAPRRGTYSFELTYSLDQRRITVGVLSGGDRYWIPSTVTQTDDASTRRFEVSVDLPAHEECWLVVSNDHPAGTGVTKFVVQTLQGSCDPLEMLVERRRRFRSFGIGDRKTVAYAKLAARARALRSLRSRDPLATVPERSWKVRVAERVAGIVGGLVGRSVRYRIARRTPEYQS